MSVEEPTNFDLGVCEEHNRQNEAYCEVCQRLICPSCLMFGSCKGHSVLPPGQAAMFIRDQIDQLSKGKKLSPDYSGRILQDIRDTKFKAQQLQSSVMSQIDEKFNGLISALKARRAELRDNVIDHFAEEINKIEEEESKWEKREDIAKELLKVSSSEDDEALVRNCYEILQSVSDLAENVDFKTFHLITNVNVAVDTEDKLEFADLVDALESVGTFGDKKQIQLRS